MARSSAKAVATTEQSAGSLDFAGLDSLLGFDVRLTDAAIYRDWMASVKGLELTQKQFSVLTLVDANPGCSQMALSSALTTDRATMMAIVDRLEDKHLLVRTRSRTDRRRQELFLTKTGRALLDEAQRLIADHERRLVGLYNQEELTVLRGLLRRMRFFAPEA